MPMDVRISANQATAIYNAERKAKLNKYTKINGIYHYSWHPANSIVVGVGLGPDNHRNFTCTISNQLAIGLTAAGGALPVNVPGGINAAALLTSVSNALRERFRELIQDETFNTIGRSPQQIVLNNTRVANRHDSRRLRIGATLITQGGEHLFAGGKMNGFAVVQNFPGLDTYYRNYDVREDAVARNGERLRILHADQGDQVRIDGTGSGPINVVRL